MTRFATLVAVLAAAFAFAGVAHADDGDAATLSRSSALIGQQITLKLQVVTVRGATVEVDPAASSWNGVELVRIESQTSRDEGDRTIHSLRLVVAPFNLGDFAFEPAVNVIHDALSTSRLLPAVQMRAVSTLAPDAKPELSPLAPPSEIGGGESPLLRPAVGLGAIAALLAVAAGLWFGGRSLIRRLRRPLAPVEAPIPEPDLGGAAALIDSDPVNAYRKLALSVRWVISERYGFPAYALTTGELAGRMEARGIDRWQARLVGGLLEECDAVVYAGYRPAPERRQHDLTMAREIVEAGA